MNSNFGDAPIKSEGQSINATYGIPEEYEPKPQPYETTWVERPMPVELEEMAHAVLKAMYKQWLIDNGFDKEVDDETY
jgi:hypothetical protein